MIISFKQDWLAAFFHTGNHKKVPAVLSQRLIRKLDMLNAVKEVSDLRSPPSNKLHKLKGDRLGQWAISVNGPWRLCFQFTDGEVHNVELVQYH